MGTSGSYGGSGKKPWRDARQATTNAFGGGSSAPSPPPPPPLPPRDEIGDILEHVGNGLWNDDREVRPARVPVLPINQVLSGGRPLAGLPHLGARTGRRRTQTSSAVDGATGRRSRRVLGGARRTGAALGAGVALRTGNAAALAEIGLDITELRSLSPVQQTQRIVDHVFGASLDENEQAGRLASAVILLELLQVPDGTIDYGHVLQQGAAEFIYQRAVVEIAAQLAAGALDAQTARQRQVEVRSYIRDLVRASAIAADGPAAATPAACSQTVATIAATTIRALRAGGSGT